MLIKDVGDRVRNSGMWPAVIDTSSQASVFLRYMVRVLPAGICRGAPGCYGPD